MKLLAETWHKLLPITLGIGISRHFLYSEIQIRSMKWVCAGLRDLEKTKTGMTTQGPATLHFFPPRRLRTFYRHKQSQIELYSK
jgi:hypothetical protein